MPAAQVRAVAGLVVGDLNPVTDVAGDAVLAGGLLEVEVGHRRDGALGVQQLVVVSGVEVGLPDRRVVDVTIRLGDLVVKRARVAASYGVSRVAELAEQGEDLVLALECEFDELAGGELDNLVLALALRLAAQHELLSGLLHGHLPRAEGCGHVVRMGGDSSVEWFPCRDRCGNGARHEGGHADRND